MLTWLFCFLRLTSGTNLRVQESLHEKLRNTQKALMVFDDLDNGQSSCKRDLSTNLGNQDCEGMSQDIQSFYALKYTNCHLEEAGLNQQTISCETVDRIQDCTSKLGQIPNAFQTYTQFRIHITNYCLIIQNAGQEKKTQRLIHDLYESTYETAQNLDTLNRDAKKNQEELQLEIKKRSGDITTQLEGLSDQTKASFETMRHASNDLSSQMVESLDVQNYLKTAQGDALDKIIETHAEVEKLKQEQLAVLTKVAAATAQLKQLAAQHDKFVGDSLNALIQIEKQQSQLKQETEAAYKAAQEHHNQELNEHSESKDRHQALLLRQGQLADQLSATMQNTQAGLSAILTGQEVSAEAMRSLHQLQAQSIEQLQQANGDLAALTQSQQEAFTDAKGSLNDIKATTEGLNDGVKAAQEHLNKLSKSQQESFQNASDYLESIEKKAKEANENINTVLSEVSSGVERLLAMDYSMLGQMFTISATLFYAGVMGMLYMITSPRQLSKMRLPSLLGYAMAYAGEWYVATAVPWFHAEYCTCFRQALVSATAVACFYALFKYQDYVKENYHIATENKELLTQLVDWTVANSPRSDNRSNQDSLEPGSIPGLEAVNVRQHLTFSDRTFLKAKRRAVARAPMDLDISTSELETSTNTITTEASSEDDGDEEAEGGEGQRREGESDPEASEEDRPEGQPGVRRRAGKAKKPSPRPKENVGTRRSSRRTRSNP